MYIDYLVFNSQSSDKTGDIEEGGGTGSGIWEIGW